MARPVVTMLPKLPRFLALCFAVAAAGATGLVVCPVPTSAQAATFGNANAGVGPDADPAITEADELYWDQRVLESLEILEELLDSEPENYAALRDAARSSIARGLLSTGRDVQTQWYRIGESYARRATEVEPELIDGYYWQLTAKGLRAVRTGGRDAASLSGEVYELAHQVLEMDSLHAGAHHALGVLNYRIRRLSGIERFVAGNFMGGWVIGLTSWEDAESYLTRAIELRPDYILFHLDFGRMLLNRERMDEARRQFERVLALPVFEPPDVRFQEAAERRLAETRP